jgi:aminoglycoside phosphotransferase (APT) family kinase protein
MALVGTADLAETTARLTAWLSTKAEYPDGAAVRDVRIPEGSGLSNDTVMFDAPTPGGGGPVGMVARVQPTAPGLFPDYDLEMQYRLLHSLGARTKVPVPRAMWHETDSSVLGAPFIVMERVEGRVPPDNPPFTAAGWFMDLKVHERATLCDNGLAALAAIHGVDVNELDAERVPRTLDAQIAFYQRYYDWAREGGADNPSIGTRNPTIEAAFEWLDRNRPDDPSHLVLNWGDARVGNLIFATDLSVAAVLDWEMASLCPAEVDLGWWVFLDRHHTEGMGVPRPEGMPDAEQTIARYAELTGYTPRHMRFYQAFAGIRVAIMMVRTATLMIAAGALPPDSQFALSNPGSVLLADLIGAPTPPAATENVLGAR